MLLRCIQLERKRGNFANADEYHLWNDSRCLDGEKIGTVRDWVGCFGSSLHFVLETLVQTCTDRWKDLWFFNLMAWQMKGEVAILLTTLVPRMERTRLVSTNLGLRMVGPEGGMRPQGAFGTLNLHVMMNSWMFFTTGNQGRLFLWRGLDREGRGSFFSGKR